MRDAYSGGMGMAFESSSRAAVRSSLDRYLEEVGAFPRLSREEEQRLATGVRTGCAESAHRLICCNLRLVVDVARRCQDRGVALADLIHAGNLGLIRAVDCFDERRGVRFASFATGWIRHAVAQTLAERTRQRSRPAARVSPPRRVRAQRR